MNRFNYGLLAGVVAVMPVFSLGAQEVGQCAIKPTCASMGYQQKAADCTGKDMLKCPFDSTAVFCGGDACAADFTLSSCDSSKGTCEECGGKYKYTKCNNGWTLSNGNCAITDCSAYKYTSASIANCASVDSCKSGYTITYGCHYCDTGYDIVSGGSCRKLDCYDNCHYKNGDWDDAYIANLPSTERKDCWPTLGCFRNGTLVYYCASMGVLDGCGF